MFKISIILFFLLSFTDCGISQDVTSDKQEHILVEIEDSVRTKLKWQNDSASINSGLNFQKPNTKNDSTWINSGLNFQRSITKIDSVINYKLVKIEKKNFYEGPHKKIFNEEDSNQHIASQYGDSALILTGFYIYTSVGNSSWGYYYEYHLVRVDKILTGSDLWYNQKCNKGHNKGIAQPCDICYEENNEEIEKQILLKINGPDTCEHGRDMNLGLACYQCLHSSKMQYNSVYRKNYIKDSITKMQEILMAGCAHGHNCCETTFCECCPDSLRRKDFIFSVNDTNKTFNKKVKIGDAQLVSVELENIDPDCFHSHDCCTFNCECCPSLSKKEKRQLIRKKKRTYRRNMRKYNG